MWSLRSFFRTTRRACAFGIDGKAKMSKSLGNCIYLSEEPEENKKKVFSMFTDPTHIRIEDPGKLEENHRVYVSGCILQAGVFPRSSFRSTMILTSSKTTIRGAASAI